MTVFIVAVTKKKKKNDDETSQSQRENTREVSLFGYGGILSSRFFTHFF